MSKVRSAKSVNGKMFAVDKDYLKVVSKKIGKSIEQTLHILLNEHAQMSKRVVGSKPKARRVVVKGEKVDG